MISFLEKNFLSQKILEAEAEAEVQALKGEAEAFAIEVKAKVGYLTLVISLEFLVVMCVTYYGLF